MTMISLKSVAVVFLISGLLIPVLLSTDASAQLVPEWIKTTAKWFGDDLISENEFLNAMKYLIENGIIILDFQETQISNNISQASNIQYVIIPNGNNLQGNSGFYIPLNLEVKVENTVIWQNDDSNAHTVQSQDADGNPSGIFNSNVLQTGDTFDHKFTDTGEYHYYCTIHPWRIGLITVR